MSSKLQSREYAGNITAPDVNIFKKESFKQNEKQRVLDEDYFLYYLKNMFKDNLNEYPNKQLERPNKLDLTNQDDKELTMMEEKKWKDHDLLLEQRRETFKNFTFPKHMSPQEKCVDQLQNDYDDFHMLCLRDMFRDRSTDLEGFDRTPAQDKDELKEMNCVHESLLQEKSRLSGSNKGSSMKKKSSPVEKRTIIRQTKTTTTRIFKKPNNGMQSTIPIKTEIVSETITKPINDPKSKPLPSTETCYSVDLSHVNNNSWIWDKGEIKKL